MCTTERSNFMRSCQRLYCQAQRQLHRQLSAGPTPWRCAPASCALSWACAPAPANMPPRIWWSDLKSGMQMLPSIQRRQDSSFDIFIGCRACLCRSVDDSRTVSKHVSQPLRKAHNYWTHVLMLCDAMFGCEPLGLLLLFL